MADRWLDSKFIMKAKKDSFQGRHELFKRNFRIQIILVRRSPMHPGTSWLHRISATFPQRCARATNIGHHRQPDAQDPALTREEPWMQRWPATSFRGFTGSARMGLWVALEQQLHSFHLTDTNKFHPSTESWDPWAPTTNLSPERHASPDQHITSDPVSDTSRISINPALFGYGA